MKKNLLYTALGLMGMMGTLAIGVVNAQEINKDIVLEAITKANDQTLKINKYFANAYTVDRGDGSLVETVSSDKTHTYSVASGYTITLSTTADRWTFRNVSKPLVDATRKTDVKIVYMPSLADGFGNSETNPGNYFFSHFNDAGSLTSLPIGSFDTSKITTVGNNFFSDFNNAGSITSLPAGSFNTSNISGVVGDNFFSSFNAEGLLTSLPTGSFNTSKITTVGNGFFSDFNDAGLLTSLPTGSFNTSKITTVGNGFFTYFNDAGSLTSLPEGSFDMSKITTAGDRFFSNFNGRSTITNLPDSFKLTSAAYNKSYPYQNAFNSPVYEINKKVSDLVEGITPPSSDQNTFSDNQPGRCGVHPNWLVNPGNACKIIYDANGGTGTITGGYMSNVTGVIVGSGIEIPTREGYTLSGWQDASGNIVEEVVFPDMDGQTLYANWTPNKYTITFVDGSGTETDVIYTGAYESAVNTQYPEWTKEGYTIHWDKEIPSTMPLSGDTITASWTINEYTITLDVDGTLTTITGDYGSPITKPSDPTKNGYKFIGWEPEFPTTMPLSGATVKAKWEKLGSSGGGGGSSRSSNDSQISPDPSLSRGEEDSSLIKEGDREAVEDLKDNTPMDSSDKSSEGQTYTQEFQEAYEFAKEKGITTMPTINDANMNGKLTRIAMAKMLSYYAINVLGMKPDETRINKFNDITEKLDAQYDSGVTLAYQLGIMGINMPDNKFRPNDEVTRAEFGTALSRMLYSTPDGKPYYTTHLEKLKAEKILTNDDYKMKELRGYVMIMLMRSSKK